MPAHSVVEEYFSGQGVVMIGTRDANGKAAGLRPVGNCPSLSIKNATSVLEHKESTTGARGTDKRLTTEIKVTLDMTLENFNSKNLAQAIRGTVTSITGATVSDVAYKAYSGLVTPLAHIKLSSVVVKQGATTLTPFVDDTTDWDYKVNTEAGSLLFNGGANVDLLTYTAGSADVLVSYTYASQQSVGAFTTGQAELFLRFEGLNTAEGDVPVVVDVFRFTVDPTQDLSLISDALQQFVLSGSVLKDSKQSVGSQYYAVKKVDLT